MDKQAALTALDQGWHDCDRCPLQQHRQRVVFGDGYIGDGDRDAIMFVGQAPGQNENRIGKSFVGVAGELLMEVLMHICDCEPEIEKFIPKARGNKVDFPGLRRELDKLFYFTNTVLCWPLEDRKPATKEMKVCWERLAREIYVVDPVLIITLGKTAMQGVSKYRGGIEGAHGSIFNISIPGLTGPVRYPVFATYHPSYISRIGDFTAKEGRFAAWYQDIARALKYVDEINHAVHGDPIPER